MFKNDRFVNFDFGTPLTCDSVYYHGAKLAVGKIVRPTDLLNLTIPNIAASGTLDSISVFYKGVPQVEPLFNSGYRNAVHNTTQNYTYTLSEPYSSFTWWPCKSYIANDKADSVDLIVWEYDKDLDELTNNVHKKEIRQMLTDMNLEISYKDIYEKDAQLAAMLVE